MLHPRSTYSKSNLMLPNEDPRINVKGNEVEKRKSWLELQTTHTDQLKIYQLLVSRLLSRIDGLHLDTLRHVLRVQYLFDSKAIEKFIYWMTNNELKLIEWDTPTINTRRPMIYLSPRTLKPSIIGTYSKWSPDKP